MRCIIQAFPLSKTSLHWLLKHLAEPIKLLSCSAVVRLRTRSIEDAPRSQITVHQYFPDPSHKDQSLSPVVLGCILILSHQDLLPWKPPSAQICMRDEYFSSWLIWMQRLAGYSVNTTTHITIRSLSSYPPFTFGQHLFNSRYWDAHFCYHLIAAMGKLNPILRRWAHLCSRRS